MIENRIFMDKRYIQFEDDGKKQLFFDTETRFIYMVQEFITGGTVIREFPDDSEIYNEYFAEYIKRTGETYTVKMKITTKEVNQYEVEKMIKGQLMKEGMVVTKMEIERDR